MIIFFQILIALFSYLIVKSRGEERLAYFYAALFLIPGSISLTPYVFFFKEHLILVTSFFISLKWHRELHLRDFKETGMFEPLVFVYVAYLLVGFMDERLSWVNAIYKATYTFEGTYFAFLVGWLAINRNGKFDVNKFLRIFLRFSLITTIFGIITFMLKKNPVLDAIGFEDRFVKESIEMEIRAFRVTSFFVSSSVYALVCGYFSFIGTVFLKNKKKTDIIALILLFVNCLLSGTRAGIFPVLILFLLYYIIMFKKKIASIWRPALIAVTALALSYIFIPATVNKVVNQYSTMLMSISDDEAQEEMSGSSMEARSLQMATALEYLREKPLFGHGMGYAREIFGEEKHDELLGMESYICFLGVEYGGVFIVCISIFFISIFRYFYKALRIDRGLVLAGLLMLLCFILFLIYAWIGDIWLYILPLFGLLAKQIYCKSHPLYSQQL